jgi:hypothetical protein
MHYVGNIHNCGTHTAIGYELQNASAMRIRNRDFFLLSARDQICHKLPALCNCSVLHFFFTCDRSPRPRRRKKLRSGVQKAVTITCQPRPPFLAATELATRSRVRMPAHKKRTKCKNFV